MTRFTRHVVLPSVAPLAILALWLTPVETFGCRGRGLLAVGVALAGALAAFATIALGFREQMRNERTLASWWMLSAAILALPIVLLLGPLG